MNEYPIFENDTQIGNVIITQEGLYCKIHCNYHTTEKRHHLACCGADQTFVLGTGVPYKQEWVLKRFIPMGMLPGKYIKFILKSNAFMQKLTPGEPVAHISQILTGKLYCCEDGYWVSGAAND